MVCVPWDFPFNIGHFAATHYPPGALMKAVKRRLGLVMYFQVRLYCFTASPCALLRAQARSHARFGGCPPGQWTATSESGVFVSALPARHYVAPHPIGGNPVPRLACAPALAAVVLHLECHEESRPSRYASTVPGTFAFPAVQPSPRSGGLANSALPSHNRCWVWR